MVCGYVRNRDDYCTEGKHSLCLMGNVEVKLKINKTARSYVTLLNI